MTLERLVKSMNGRLGAELGRSPDFKPLYCWMFSEDGRMQHPMRVPDVYDYKANEHGVIEALPVYTLRKMCLTAEKQWLLCHWIASPPEDEWRRLFGYHLEWPKGGQYYPTNVVLGVDEEPNEILTQTVIDFIRLDRNKKASEVERELLEAADKKEAADKERLREEIREVCTTYDHVPGHRDQVSYPAVQGEQCRQ